MSQWEWQARDATCEMVALGSFGGVMLDQWKKALYRRAVACAFMVVAALGMVASPAKAELRGHGGPVRAIAALGPGRIVTGSFDHRIIVWNVASSTARRVLGFHDGAITALARATDSCFVSGGEDGQVALWCGDEPRPIRVYARHRGPVTALAVDAGGARVASASFDRRIIVSPLTNAVGEPVVIESAAPVNGIVFSSDRSELFAAGYDGTLRSIRLDDRLTTRRVQIGSPINNLVLAGNEELVAATADGKLLFFDLALNQRASLEIQPGPLTSLAISPDGNILASAGLQGSIAIVERRARTKLTSIEGPGMPVWSLAFDRSGSILYTGGADRVVRRWDGNTGRPLDPITTETTDTTLPEPQHRGAAVFRACRACHGLTASDTNRAGPTLHGIFNRRIATEPSYQYSPALKQLDIIWTPETVAKLFEVGPALYTPGTKMPEQKITDPGDRAALVDWLAKVTR
jgi:cytochrome c